MVREAKTSSVPRRWKAKATTGFLSWSYTRKCTSRWVDEFTSSTVLASTTEPSS